MNVFRAAAAAHEGSAVTGFFHGHAQLTGLASAGPAPVRMSRVSFDAGARTVWHSHEDGQLLVIVDGTGRVASREHVESVGVGDVVWTDAGEEHWHGADDEGPLVHIAISLGETSWERP